MSRQVNSGDPSSGYPSKKTFDQNGTISDADLTIVSVTDVSKKIVFDASSFAAGSTTTVIPGSPGTLQYAAPVTTDTVTMAAGTVTLVLEPAGTIALGTIVFPTAPANGTIIRFSTTAEITGLTLTPGAGDTIVNAVTTLLANTAAKYAYRASTKKWYII